MYMQSILSRVLFSLGFVFLAGDAFAQTRIIAGAAGNGTAGYSGDGGQATAARLNSPSDVTVDSSGDLYIADRNNNRVRKVDVSTGVISTIAGSGVAGWFFSGGPALFASLDHPSGVAVDTAGNLYIADLLENDISRIHKLTISNGRISKVELPVLLKGAVAIALDSAGHLYIAEQAGHRIRRVTLSNLSISVFAGNGVPGFSGDGGPAVSAELNSPVHLAVDAAGNVYFSDSLNNRIRKIAAGTGIISTVAGTGAAGFSGDGGPGTSASFNNPRGVAIDSAGNIFVADTLNRRIRRISARTGIVTTIVSGDMTGAACEAASSSLRTPDSLSVNAAGTMLYVADDGGNRIWKVTLDPNSPPPTLTSITPASGVPGATVVTALAGSGFQGGAGPTGSGCSVNGTTVFVSGVGVTVAGTSVTADGSMSVTLAIAPDAPAGPREVTVTTDSGTTAPVTFTVSIAPPTLTGITPASAARGTTMTITLAGTNFDPAPGGTTVAIEGAGIATGDIQVANPGSLSFSFTMAPDVTLGVHNVTVATASGGSNAVRFLVLPQGPTFTYGLPPMLNPTQQTPIQVSLASPLPDDVTATLTLTFVPNTTIGTDDPNVMFINPQLSTRTVQVEFPANTSTAELSLSSGVLQAGTVAGTIELSAIDVHVGGVSAAPTNSDFDVQVPRLPPVITSVRIVNRSPAGFDVEIIGYSTTRDITAATFNFGAASGAHLLTVELQPDVSSSFGTYYQSGTSFPAGGAFVYMQPFIVQQGDVNAVASVTVTLANAQGRSEPKTAQ
jgi:sugar lactone lactonase YvrE